MILYMIIPGSLLGWIFRRAGFVDVAGFLIGGVLSYFMLSSLGLNVEVVYDYTRPLQLIGLILFFFETGASLDVKGIGMHIHVVMSSELVVATLAWVATGVLSLTAGLSMPERLALFTLLLNSSTVGIVAMRKLRLNGEVYERAVLQTSLEDIIQFALFGALVAAFPSRVELGRILIDSLRLAGGILILFLAARYASRLLSRSPFAENRVDKFFTLLTLAILFSTTASILGLPELFGALIAGLATSLYFKIDDVIDLLRGLRDLGLLLYFASIGLFIAPWLSEVSPGLIASILTITMISIFVRTSGCFFGLTTSGMDTYGSAVASILLSSLSETGIVFAYILFEAGAVSRDFVILAVFSVLTTMIISSALIPKSTIIAAKVEQRLPQRMVSSLNMISRVYHKRVELFVRVLSLLTLFSASSLIISSLASLLIDVVMTLWKDAAAATFILVATVTALLVLHVLFVKTISDTVLKHFREKDKPKPITVLELIVDSLMGVLAIILQLYLLNDFINRQVHELPLFETISVYATALASIATIAYNIIRFYYKLTRKK